MITSFGFDGCLNFPGIIGFDYSPVEHVCTIPDYEGVELQAPVNFKPGFTWLQGYSTQDIGGFTESDSDTGAGTVYSTSFKGVVPKNSPGILALFVQLRERKHILKIQDKNGMLRVAGTKRNPLHFRFSQDHGNGPDSLNSFVYEFYGSSFAPSPYLILPPAGSALDYYLEFVL